MDIVLLPKARANGRTSEDHRFGFVHELLRRFAETVEPVRIFAYLPECTAAERNDLLRFLIEGQRDLGSLAILIVRGHLLSSGILEHPYLPVLHQVVIDIEAPGELQVSHISAIETYAAKKSELQRPLAVWMNGSPNRKQFNPLVNLFRIARVAPELQIPEFRIGAGGAETAGAWSEVPSEWTAALPACRFYENSLTIDPDGRIIFCPRHHGAEAHLDLGSLSTESLEAILIKKGQHFPGLGSVDRCRDCHLKARLFWPESRSAHSLGLMSASATGLESSPGDSFDWMLSMRRNISTLSEMDFNRVLQEFGQRLRKWSEGSSGGAGGHESSMVSIETPVIKAGWLLPCIESVLNQTSMRWHFSLLWDHGDERSRRILKVLEQLNDPRISVYFGDGVGVARARRFLTDRTSADYILPLDDDDLLSSDAVERFLEAAEAKPWSGIIRARRDFVGEAGTPVEMQDWFPFGPRQYHRGMTRDLYNHSQPYLIARRAYDRTAGWEGFKEYRFAGEDCDIFAKIEEVAEIELLDAVLYSYRLSDCRTSHELGTAAAEDMWQRLAIHALERRRIPLELANIKQPFTFSATVSPRPDSDDCDLVILAAAGAADQAGQIDSREEWSSKTGIGRDAIHVLAPDQDVSKAMVSALAQSGRNYVCLMRGAPPEGSRQAIQNLLREMETHNADLAGPKTLDCSGRLVSADPYFDSELMPATSGRLELDEGRFDYVAHAPWLPATMLVVRRHVFRSIGALEPALDGSLQDADFCLRARRRGFTCLYAGNVTFQLPAAAEAPPRADDRRYFHNCWGRCPELLFPEQVIPQ